MLDPEWITAGAEMAIAAEHGVVMFGRKPKVDAAPAQAGIPSAGLSIAEAIVIAAALVSLAMLTAAVVIRSCGPR